VEFLIGAIVTLIVYITTFRIARKNMDESSRFTVKYSQSHIYGLMKPYLEFEPYVKPPKETQASNYLTNAYVKVMIVKDRAYWIKNNKFYTADVMNGQVQNGTTKEVDTMSMDKVELDKMLFIVEKLREGTNDSGSSGQSNL
jgi:hypothetical protein